MTNRTAKMLLLTFSVIALLLLLASYAIAETKVCAGVLVHDGPVGRAEVEITGFYYTQARAKQSLPLWRHPNVRADVVCGRLRP